MSEVQKVINRTCGGDLIAPRQEEDDEDDVQTSLRQLFLDCLKWKLFDKLILANMYCTYMPLCKAFVLYSFDRLATVSKC